MKNFICIFLLACMYTVAHGQNQSSANCADLDGFNPAMWEVPSREPLQRELLAIAGDLKGKTVLDIGAGSGYFTFAFASKSKKIIATELDKRFLDYIEEKEKSLNLKNVETRLADTMHSELSSLSQVDVTLMVLVFNFIEDPREFITKLHATMNKGGQIIVVNSDGLSPRFITDYLEAGGFSQFSIKKISLKGNCNDLETFNIISAKK